MNNFYLIVIIDIKWDTLGLNDGISINVQATVDPTTIINEKVLEEFSSPIFDQF